MIRSRLSLLLSLTLFACVDGVVEPVGFQLPRVAAVHVDDPSLAISAPERRALAAAGMTRCSTPFGVLIAADERMPVEYVELAARVLAELLDQDLDGVPDDPLVLASVQRHELAWLAMPVDPREWEERQLPLLGEVLGYDIIIPTWWLESDDPHPLRRVRAVVLEEVLHFLTQFGYGPLYPREFGVEDWSSVIARETRRAQCEFWQHPENDCPGSPARSQGDCSEPSCDVVEFYQQVLVTRAGMRPGWLGIGFPADAAALEAVLGAEIKAVMEDPRFHQLRRPLTFSYGLR